MDARFVRIAAVLAAAGCSLGASWRSENFIVEAPTEELAREFCETAEHSRNDLAVEWLGHELPLWQQPCAIHVNVGRHLASGGATSFGFGRGGRGELSDCTMQIQGSRERLNDGVIPHEVLHLVLGTHFGKPLPRWADEGAAISVESKQEKDKHAKLLVHFLDAGEGIEIDKLLPMKDYPSDILPLFAEGFSVTRYLLAQGGKRRFVGFLEEAMKTDDWGEAVRKHYGFANLSKLESKWRKWVAEGSPQLADAPTLAGRKYRKQLRKRNKRNPASATMP